LADNADFKAASIARTQTRIFGLKTASLTEHKKHYRTLSSGRKMARFGALLSPGLGDNPRLIRVHPRLNNGG
jgi:hypothetical protein